MLFRLLSIFIIYYCLAFPLVAQSSLSPTEDKALITFRIYNPTDQQPWKQLPIRLSGEKLAATIKLITNNNGEVQALLPVDDSYKIQLRNEEKFGKVNIGAGAYQDHLIPIPYDGKSIGHSPLDDQPAENIMVRILVQKKDGSPNPHQETIYLKDLHHQKNYKVKTNRRGIAALSLPKDGQFRLSLDAAPNYYEFSIPKEKALDIWEESIPFERKKGYTLYPSIEEGLINFRYIDLNGRPAANETFIITHSETGKQHRCTTNVYGIAQVRLPLGHSYYFSTPYNPNFEKMKVVLSEGFDVFEFEILYQSPTSEEWKHKIAEMNAIAALRDSISRKTETVKTTISTDPKATAKDDDLLDFDSPIPFGKVKTFKIRKIVKEKAERYKDSLAINPTVFDDHSKPVLSTLNRFRDAWQNKLVITDVTASMKPYMEEVLIWHALNLVKGEHCKYVFFNDGDDKIRSQKKIGQTGGIYTCEGGLADLDAIIGQMQHASSFRMGGGEPPENDVEALLAGLQQRDSLDEIILIVDAHSRIRDMELLYKVDLPVRIILCGAEENSQFYLQSQNLNEQYLTIAHRTNGSIHTLTKDILDLSQKSDGDVIELQGIRYLLKNHQFIRL